MKPVVNPPIAMVWDSKRKDWIIVRESEREAYGREKKRVARRTK